MVDKDENSKNTENRKSTSRSAAGRKTAPKSAATAVSALGESEAGKTGLIPDDATGESTTDRPKRRKSNARSEAGSGPAKASKSEAGSGPAKAKKNTDSKPEEASRADKPAGLAPLFQAPDLPKRKAPAAGDGSGSEESNSSLRHRTRRRSGEVGDLDSSKPNTVVKVRQPRKEAAPATEPQKVKGSTRLEAKKQRRRDGRDAGRKRTVITEAEFLARRESVDRVMVVRGTAERIQIGVLEDGVLVEHYVARSQDASLIGNVYIGKVQNVLPSMEAAFVDIGRGRNAVLYSGEVDWDAAAESASEGKQQARKIELALKPGDRVLVQVTKDPVGHKGARLTSQVSLPGRYLVYVPNGSMNGISRKLPDTERTRLKKILKEILPENVGVIVRTAAEGASEEQLTLDVSRLAAQWKEISASAETVSAPSLLHSEPDLLVKIIRDVFNEDFQKLVVSGDEAMQTIQSYLSSVAPDLAERVEKYEGERDAFDEYRISEQIEKALDRKVWLPSGGSLIIDRTEAMTVIDVNTGKFVGSGGNLEETVTKNNLEAAEEIVRQLRLRDIGGIIVVDFIDMVLESNRDLVLRRLVECLARDRTKHQVAEVTSLGLVQMTRKKLGLGLLESFSEPCEVCAGRGIIVHHEPVSRHKTTQAESKRGQSKAASQNGRSSANGTHAITEDVKNALAKIAASTITSSSEDSAGETESPESSEPAAVEVTEPAEAEIVQILDIPLKRSRREPPVISAEAAEQLLDSVLDSLPENPPTAQNTQNSSGEAKSPRRPRRATSADVGLGNPN